MLYSSVETAAAPLAALLAPKQHVLVITHLHPDGDAIGSLVGLGLALEQRGHTVTLVAPSAVPDFLGNLPEVERVQNYLLNPNLPADAALVILVDTGDLSRIGTIWQEQQPYLRARPIAVIDHHATNSGEGAISLVNPAISSTCELVYSLLHTWDVAITPMIATALLFGVTTDTQSFRTSNTTPSALRTAAALLEAGANVAQITTDIYHSTPFTHGKLLGLALTAMRAAGALVWTSISQAMLAQAGAEHEAAAEVTHYFPSLAGFRAYAMLKEMRNGEVRVSLRSVAGVDVASVAQQFGGGGHRQAAGCTLPGPLVVAEQRLLAALHAMLATT